MNRTLVAMVLSLAVLAGLLSVMVTTDSRPRPGGIAQSAAAEPVMLYCAASNRAVMEAIKTDYETDTGRRLEIQYGPSQTLLSSIEVSHTGDLYLPADDSYLTMAREKGLVDEMIPLARQQGVVAVRKGNPKSIMAFDDLLRDGVRLLQANPDATAIGNITRKVLEEQQLWDSLDHATTAYRTTVTEVANDVLVGAADAGIVYDAVLHTYPDLEFVELPELQNAASDIAIGVVSGTSQPQRALHFARFVSAGDRGLKRYAEFSFRVKQGDEWADVPELSVFAGSMLRPAIDSTISEFEGREGVHVTRVYNGCGILVAQMKSGQHPDAYFACDTEFMQQVPDLFPESVDVTQNELVILVQKGNPHGIKTLQDLTTPGLRVGVGHEKQCAMGWLTQNTLQEGGVQREVMANVTVQAPTGDMLVNQLRTGSLDAAVAYLSNAAGSAEHLDAIRIHGVECSVATQPFAIAQQSRYRQLASRLFERICSADSQQDFEAEGFRWQVGAELRAAGGSE
ncbi:MAG: molybdate ABC transporter substrate-binding protein [Fuerstiella sp.]|jgi:molybdenum ABC transporter molybdate-binding protein|nr:molybdate ABC transporter substrate-binding protein [Fuerstiella sp.]